MESFFLGVVIGGCFLFAFFAFHLAVKPVISFFLYRFFNANDFL